MWKKGTLKLLLRKMLQQVGGVNFPNRSLRQLQVRDISNKVHSREGSGVYVDIIGQSDMPATKIEAEPFTDPGIKPLLIDDLPANGFATTPASRPTAVLDLKQDFAPTEFKTLVEPLLGASEVWQGWKGIASYLANVGDRLLLPLN